ncbi:GNAT family N-acetyltransferase [Pseudoalteromonas sp. MMG022]|uniref:GNAT family N-acetyltransferase n=1 Tax=Pseudoalteromonas sp. MMG022 TaxID=2909978 RepID=UPI001F17284E|nr:GNAT family N-acetyltransferase [Pseudoalteromonas sp. MMG022]MCF6435563.1 GNAT family N-acetyltransferase [Pseudoalteromonas sp. MMG022]
MSLSAKSVHHSYHDEHFTLRVMQPKFSEPDYHLVMRNQQRLRALFAGQADWPKPDMTLADNIAAMEHHLREFNDNIAYGFCVFDSKEKECIGSVYIDPSEVDGYDCELHYWLDNAWLELEPVLETNMLTWLKTQWGFSNPALVARAIPLKQWQEMKKAS